MTASAASLSDTLPGLRARIETELAARVPDSADCPTALREAMLYSLLAGGKRIRPVLVLLAAETCNGDIENAIPAACAIEMIHTYSLIHDDLPAMDDDDLRRGRPTCHVQFGEATAILAGDGLLTLAFEVIANEVRPADVAAACCAELASAAGMCGMVGGQAADLEAETNGIVDGSHLESIHRRKTGRLLTCALILGAKTAQADHVAFRALETYGNCVGLAFQIADDLLDVTGERQKMGKGVQKDASRGKLTYPAVFGTKRSRETAEQLIQTACDALLPFGDRGRRLEQLAHFVLERDH